MKGDGRVADFVPEFIGWIFAAAVSLIAVAAALIFSWAIFSADSAATFLTKAGIVAGLVVFVLWRRARSDTSRVGTDTGYTSDADVLDRMLRMGLSYAQASTLAGNFGKLVSRSTSMCVTATYVWHDPGGASLHAEFEDGRLMAWIFSSAPW